MFLPKPNALIPFVPSLALHLLSGNKARSATVRAAPLLLPRFAPHLTLNNPNGQCDAALSTYLMPRPATSTQTIFSPFIHVKVSHLGVSMLLVLFGASALPIAFIAGMMHSSHRCDTIFVLIIQCLTTLFQPRRLPLSKSRPPYSTSPRQASKTHQMSPPRLAFIFACATGTTEYRTPTRLAEHGSSLAPATRLIEADEVTIDLSLPEDANRSHWRS